MLIDANAPERMRGLAGASAILCDTYTASRLEVPKKLKRFVFPLLSESAKELLRPFERTVMRDGRVVTPAKVS